MCGVIFSIDHIVFAATRKQRDDLMAELGQLGFRPEAFTLEFPEIGATSESLSFSEGAFVEFVVCDDERLAPTLWFERTPRVIGLGFSSDDFAADTDWWDWREAWRMNEDHVLPGGDVLNIHAAGPHKHRSPFYVFVMDRSDGRLEFPSNVSGPKLERIAIAGRRAEDWRRQLSDWLRMPWEREKPMVGATELTFADGDHADVAVSLVFSDAGGAASEISLAAGTLSVRPPTR
jgi:hypothetical protein